MPVGKLVALRPLEAGDAERINRWHRAPELYRTLLGEAREPSLADTQRWLAARAVAPDEVNLAICARATGEHVGNLYLREVDRAAGTAEIHMFIAAPTDRGRGLGSEAMALAVDWADTHLGVRWMRLEVLADHASAIRIYLRMGFQTEHRLERHVVKDGRPRDVLRMVRDAQDSSSERARSSSRSRK